MSIHYEPHPVSAERKAELRKQGKEIIDARFAPKGWAAEEEAEAAEAPAKRTKKRRKAN